MNDELYKSIFMSKPFELNYDKFIFEISVKKREAQHYVKCSFRNRGDFREAYKAIFNFFNELVWFYQTIVSDVNGGHSQGSHIGLNYQINTDSYLLDFKQQVFEERQHLALVFYREAQCNESPYYRFFCFHKILEMPFKRGVGKKEWFENSIAGLKTDLAKNARNRLSKQLHNKSLADWLYENGRHAIAHARLDDESTIDPNDYGDWEEIKWANVIMQELAESTIVEKAGIRHYA